jgi:hypothetical protein
MTVSLKNFFDSINDYATIQEYSVEMNYKNNNDIRILYAIRQECLPHRSI